MNRLNDELCIEGVVKLQERMERISNSNVREETKKSNTDLTIAMLWTITQ